MKQFLLIFLVGLVFNPIKADVLVWRGGSGSFHEAGNWINVTTPSNNKVPGSADEIVITAEKGQLISITFTKDIKLKALKTTGSGNIQLVSFNNSGIYVDQFDNEAGSLSLVGTRNFQCSKKAVYSKDLRIIDKQERARRGNGTGFIPQSLNIVSINSINVTCGGVCDGMFIVNATTDCPLGEYSVSFIGDNGTNVTLSNISSGTNDTLKNLCKNGESFIIIFYECGDFSTPYTDGNTYQVAGPSPIVLFFNPSSPTVSCTGTCDGTFNSITVAGGNIPIASYTYSWSNGETTKIPTALCAGKNYVTTTDTKGCKKLDSVIVQSPPPIDKILTLQNVSCTGLCDGSATASATGGTGTLSYSWFNSAGTLISTGTNITGLCVGNYSLLIKDTKNCKDSTGFTIVNPNPITVTKSHNDASCFGVCDGSITLNISGGTSPYTVTSVPALVFSVSGSIAIASSVCADIYSITVEDDNGCTVAISDTIGQPPRITIIPSATPSAYCVGGSSTLSASSSISLNYSWSGGVTTPTTGATVSTSVSTTTTFTVTGTNPLNSCSADTTITLTVNQPPNISVTPPSSSMCLANPVNLTASGTGVVSFSWTPATGLSSTSGANVTANPSSNITYTVFGIDGNGCIGSATVPITVNTPPTISINPTNAISCALSPVNFTASGLTSGTYSWSSGSGVISGSPGPSVTVTPTINTIVTVVGIDANGCSDTKTATLTIQPLPTISASASSSPICQGFSTFLFGSGAGFGGTYSWVAGGSTIGTDNPQIVSPSTTTTYTVFGTDANGCQNSSTVTVNVTPKPNVSVSVSSPVCSGTTVTASASGAVSYTWYDSSGGVISSTSTASITPTATTTLTVVGTSSVGCVDTVFATVVVNPLPTITGTANPPDVCPGNPVTLTGSGAGVGAIYTWTAGAFYQSSSSPIIVTPSATTDYTVTATDANGCSGSSVVTAVVNPPITIAPNNPTICAGDPATLTASGAVTYTWFDDIGNQIGIGASVTVSPVITTVYTVQATDANNCTGTQTVTVTVNPFLPLNMPSDTTICLGSTANLTATSSGIGVTYTWTGLAMTPASGIGQTIAVNPVPAGTYDYNLVATDVNGCTASGSTRVTVIDLPTVTAPGSQSVCLGSSVSLTAGGALTYSWFISPGGVFQGTGSPFNASPTSSTIYSVVGTDGNGCSNSAFTSVVVNALPVADAGTDQTICLGNSATLSASGGVSYSWSPTLGLSNPLIANPVASPVSNTSYTVYVTDGNGCTSSSSVQVTVTTLTVSANANSGLICSGNSTTLISSPAGAVNYLWSPATGLSNPNIANPVATPTSTTVYTVQVQDANGCIGADTALIIVDNVQGSVVITNPSACGVSDGSIDLTVTSGMGPFTFSWSSGDVTEDLINVLAGSYSVTITDSKGCSNSVIANVNNITSIDFTGTVVQNVSTCSGNDGSITLSITGVSGFETYSWSNGANTQNISGLVAGSYTLTVTDGPCVVTETFDVNEPTPIPPDAGSDTTICEGSSVSLNGNLNGGSNPIWTPGGAGNNFSITPGSTTVYVLTVTDVNNCLSSDTRLVTVNALPNINAGPNINACVGNNVNLMANGAASYSWVTTGLLSADNVANPVAINVSGVVDYIVEGTDVNGCKNTDTLTIFTNPLVLTGVVSDVSVCGFADGSIDLTVSGGFSPFAFNWSNFQLTEDISGLSFGVYTVTVTDGAGCSEVATFSVNEPTTFLLSETHINSSSCSGTLADGSIDLTITGGTPPFTIAWTGPSGFNANTEDLSNLFVGQYDVLVTDASGCGAALSVTITSPTPVTVVAGSNQTVCFGDTVALSASPLGAGTYSWVGVNIVSGQNTSNPTVAPLSTSNYTVFLTDANSCVSSSSLTVFVNSVNVSLTPTDVSTCGGNDGSILVSVSSASFPIASYSWVPNVGSGGFNNTGLSVGSYTVFVTDAIGCKGSASAVINDPSNINFNGSTVNSPTSCGGNDGSISVLVGGGTAPYTYSWSNPLLVGPDVSGLVAGSYDLLVTDALNCEAFNSFVVTDPSPLGVADAGPNVSICSGQQVNFTAGTSNILTYDWSTSSGSIISGGTTSSPSVSATTTSVFTLVTTDIINCKDTDFVSLMVSPTPVINVSSSASAFCVGDAITLSSSGADFYSWTPATGLNSTVGDTVVATVSSSIVYTVIGVTLAGCSDTKTIALTPIPLFSIVKSVTNPTSCGSADGSISLNVTGGSGNYSYLWTPGGLTTSSLSGLSGGIFLCTVTDNVSGCQDTVSAVINPPSSINLSAVVFDASTCGGNGSIDLTVSGGNPPYNFSWTNGATTEDITAVSGTYGIYVTDAAGCNKSATYLINEPTPLQGNAGSDQIICSGQTTSLSASGSVNYSWISSGNLIPGPNVSSPIVNPDITTNYILVATDNNNCVTYDTVTVYVNAIISTVSVTDVSTCGGNDGAINLTVNGGNSPFTYSWSNGSLQEDLTGNLSVGTYQCVITDALGCKDTVLAFVSEPASFSISAQGNNPTGCGGTDGSISLVIQGNPLNPVTFVNGVPNAPLTNLASGFYNIVVTDQNGCSSTDGVTISSPIPIQVYAGNDTFYCSGGVVQLNANTAGVTLYSWVSTGSLSCTSCTNPVVSPSVATNYTVFGTDTNNCVTSDIVLVTPNTLNLTVSSTNATQCGAATGTLSSVVSGSTGAVSYSWSGGPTPNQPNQTNVVSGVYTLEVLDVLSGCSASGSAVISDPVNFQVSVSLTSPSTCNGSDGSLVANVLPVGTYSYQWNGSIGDSSLTGQTAGVYVLIVTDVLGCSFVKSDTLRDPQPSKPNAGLDQFLCAGATYTFNVTGGTFVSAQWTPSIGLSSANILNPIASPSASVVYTLNTVDDKNCTSYDTVAFIVSNLQVTGQVTNNPTCGASSASIDLTVVGGISPVTHNWNNGSTTEDLFNLTAGVYIDSISDGLGCIDTVVFIITDPVTFTDVNTVTPITQCGGTGGINSVVTGGNNPITYSLNGNTVSMPVTGLSPGNYTLVITDALGCSKPTFFSLSNPDTNFVNAGPDLAVCFGATGLSLNATAPVAGNYSWSPSTGLSQNNIPNPALTIDSTLTYIVSFTDAANCVYTDTVTVNATKINIVSSTIVSTSDCFTSNGSISLVTSGGTPPLSFNWSNGLTGQSINGLAAGAYSVVITESGPLSCSRTFSYNVQSQVPVITVAGNDTTYCSGDSIRLNATGAINYTWTLLNGALLGSNNPILVQPTLGVTTYVVFGSTGVCIDSDTITITLLQSPVADAGPDIQMLEGNPELIGGSPTGPQGVTYSWYPSDGITDISVPNPKVNPNQTSVYYVQIKDANGCIGIDSVKVTVYPSIIVPGGFTPNGDGANDKWIIDFIYKFPQAIVQVYNRWGQQLYESAPGYPEPWDGKYNGQDLPVGTYYYVIDLKDALVKPYTGPITIMR